MQVDEVEERVECPRENIEMAGDGAVVMEPEDELDRNAVVSGEGLAEVV